MQAINSNDNDNQDPIQELPNEMFTSILSHLPPSSIAHSSAASRSWRARILSTPTLYQVIDLTKLKDEDKDLLPIVYHFQRLSFLSLNQLTRVSLNITPFWNDLIRNQRNEIDQTFGALDILLTTLQQSQKTLKGITLIVDGPGWHWESNYDLLPFLLQLLVNLETFTSLKSIWMEAPVWFSLSAGNSKSKKITVRNVPDTIENVDSDSGWSDGYKVAEFIQVVKRMSGSSLREFLPNTYQAWDLAESSAILKELSDFSLMEKLDASCFTSSVDRKYVWESVLQSQDLNSLNCDFFGDEGLRDEDVEILQVPQGVGTTAKLSNLEFYMARVKVDWSSISRWAGDGLERLSLQLDSQSIKGLFFPVSASSLISNSKDALKELQMIQYESNLIGDPQDFQFQQEKPHSSIGNKVSFPNLEKLHLEDLEASTFQFFSNVECSKLQKLDITATHSSLASSGFNCLIQILETSDSSILELTAFITGIGSLECPQPCFNFSSLQTIRIGGLVKGNKTQIELPRWLLTSLFPNLSSMSMWDLNAEQRKQIFANLKAMGKAPKLNIESSL